MAPSQWDEALRVLSRKTCFTMLRSTLEENSSQMVTDMEPNLESEIMGTQPASNTGSVPKFLLHRVKDLKANSGRSSAYLFPQDREKTLTKDRRFLGVEEVIMMNIYWTPLSSNSHIASPSLW